MILKYIISDRGPVVFTESIIHAEAATGLGTIHSAGFLLVRSGAEGINCMPYGESFSLGVASKDGDKALLDAMFNFQPVKA